jgi:hypothetical protein
MLPHYGIPWGFTSEMLPHYEIPWGFTSEMLPHYGIPWGFTRVVMNKIKIQVLLFKTSRYIWRIILGLCLDDSSVDTPLL